MEIPETLNTDSKNNNTFQQLGHQIDILTMKSINYRTKKKSLKISSHKVLGLQGSILKTTISRKDLN